MTLMDRIQDKTAVIGVVGLGYVGLPLAVAFAEAGFCVECYDEQPTKIWGINRGESYIPDVSNRTLTILVRSKRLTTHTKLPDIWNVDAVIICVPTPITEDKKPDLSCITDAAQQVKGRLPSDNSMVILESSTYPGTTRDVVLPILDGLAKYVAYSPERVDPGSREFTIRNTPKLVGGIDKESTELATALYSCIVDNVVPVSSPDVAETAKLFENVFRNVNIALVNELALICEKIGVSVWEVIDAASTKPFGFMPFYPGPGVSGHCLPIDPYYLADKAEEHGATTKLIRLALNTNESMPNYIALQVVDLLFKQGRQTERAKILVLGVAFKRDVGDTRESAPVELIKILSSQGATVLYNDPYVPRLSRYLLSSEELTDELLESVDCVVIATDHSCYDWRWIMDKAKLIFDTRGVTRGLDKDNTYRLGERRD